MSQLNNLRNYKRHLKDRYVRLLERSNNYRFEDESASDEAAFKAMKLMDKLNRIRFLERESLL